MRDREIAAYGWNVADAIRFTPEHLRKQTASVPLESAFHPPHKPRTCPVPPERRPRCGGLGAHSPHQTRSFHPLVRSRSRFFAIRPLEKDVEEKIVRAIHGSQRLKRPSRNPKPARRSSVPVAWVPGKTRKCVLPSTAGSAIPTDASASLPFSCQVQRAPSAVVCPHFWLPRPGSNFVTRSMIQMLSTGWFAASAVLNPALVLAEPHIKASVRIVGCAFLRKVASWIPRGGG